MLGHQNSNNKYFVKKEKRKKGLDYEKRTKYTYQYNQTHSSNMKYYNNRQGKHK